MFVAGSTLMEEEITDSITLSAYDEIECVDGFKPAKELTIQDMLLVDSIPTKICNIQLVDNKYVLSIVGESEVVV